MNTMLFLILIPLSQVALSCPKNQGESRNTLSLPVSRTSSEVTTLIDKNKALNWNLDLGEEEHVDGIAKKALLLRAEQVLFEKNDELESPLNIVLSLDQEGGEGDSQDISSKRLEKAMDKLRGHLDRKETELIFLQSPEADDAESREKRGFMPENGESLEENWIFSLIIPSLSDHIFWIVLPKDENKKPQTRAYVYGFN